MIPKTSQLSMPRILLQTERAFRYPSVKTMFFRYRMITIHTAISDITRLRRALHFTARPRRILSYIRVQRAAPIPSRPFLRSLLIRTSRQWIRNIQSLLRESNTILFQDRRISARFCILTGS